MSFTEAERNQLATAFFSIRPIDLTAWLAYNAVNITAQVETDVRAQLQLWTDNDLDTDFTQLAPNMANFGIRDDPENLRQAIIRQTANLLGIDLNSIGAGSTKYLERA